MFALYLAGATPEEFHRGVDAGAVHPRAIARVEVDDLDAVRHGCDGAVELGDARIVDDHVAGRVPSDEQQAPGLQAMGLASQVELEDLLWRCARLAAGRLILELRHSGRGRMPTEARAVDLQRAAHPIEQQADQAAFIAEDPCGLLQGGKRTGQPLPVRLMTGNTVARVDLPPESFNDRLPLDGRADIYALGVALFKMLTGRPPFEGNDLNSVIKKIIGDEDPKKPLSDSAIVKILTAEGLKIARRTVAKYREELKIPSSSNRQQVFR